MLGKRGIEQVYDYHHTHARRKKHVIFSEARGALLREHVGLGKRVLDIGCRDGALTALYCEGNNILGVDIDSRALEIAEQDLSINTLHLDLNESDWNLDQGVFDRVVAGEILEHLYYPDKVIGRVASVLKPDGKFVGSVPNAFNIKNRFRLLLGQKQNTPLSDPTHINHFTREELRKALLVHFKKVEIIPIGRWSKFDFFWPGMFSFSLFFVAQEKRS